MQGASVEEVTVKTYLTRASTRRIDEVRENLWGSSVSVSIVLSLNEKAFASVEEWRASSNTFVPTAYADGIYLNRNGDSCKNMTVTVAIGVNDDGYRKVTRGSSS